MELIPWCINIWFQNFKLLDQNFWSLKSPDRSPRTSPPGDVDVLAILDFQIPCFHPKTPALYLRSLLTNHESCGRSTVDQNKDVRDDFRNRNESPHTKTRVLIFKSNMDSKYEKKSAIWIVFAYPASLICPISPNLSDGEIPAEIGSRVIRRRDTVASRRWISAWYNW